MNHAADPVDPPTRPYWNAAELAAQIRQRFEAALGRGETKKMRQAYFLVTHYYARTLLLLRQAFEGGRQGLATAALRNLLALDATLDAMHRSAPGVVPLAMPLTEDLHERYVLGLLVRILEDADTGLEPAEIAQRLEDFRLLGDVGPDDIAEPIETLATNGMIERTADGWRRTRLLFLDLSLASAVLETLVGPALYGGLSANGFHRLHQIAQRPEAFMRVFVRVSGMDAVTGALMVQVARALQDVYRVSQTHWSYRDLLHSGTPRPYQLEAYAVFRAYDYQGAVIEAPTGSGKTLIGLLCVQDWLQTLAPGQSVLVLVPTNNYQQQWVRELCYNPTGLGLSPDAVFAGTPAELARHLRRSGEMAAVVILTYAGLTEIYGGGGLNRFMEAHAVQHVILDEVHKAADDPQSITALAVKTLRQALQAGRLQGLIGFSGTAQAYHQRLEELDLRLVYTVPLLELVATGFVAPFGEYGLPFSYSEREWRVRALLEDYKRLVERFFALAGPTELIRSYTAVPLEKRLRLARDLLGMYAGRPDANAAARARLQSWEGLQAVGLAESPLVTLLQAATGKADIDLIPPDRQSQFHELLDEAGQIRAALKELLFLPETVTLLEAPNLGLSLDHAALRGGDKDGTRRQLASTMVGLYDGLKRWYQHMGEGRVAAVRAAVAAERRTRPLTGTIVFDKGRRLRWERGAVTPGFDGVAGLFSELLGDPAITPLAALSSELYLPADEKLAGRVAAYIETRLMRDEVGSAMAALLTAGLEIEEAATRRFRNALLQQLEAATDQLRQDAAAPFQTLAVHVLRPVRRAFGHRRVGLPPAAAARLRGRLNMRNDNLRLLLVTFLDYAALARRFLVPVTGTLFQASGRQRDFYAIRMPSSGRRKQLMYDLVSRLVDEKSLPINMAIVSNWARTGWNVRRPNLLIDATATRDVTAWQQLRGRAMRALPTWTNDCYRAQALLLGEEILRSQEDLPPEAKTLLDELLAARPADDAKTATRLAAEAAGGKKDIAALSATERRDAAVRLMLQHNKVTHIYELLKATGSPSQIRRAKEDGNWQRRDEIAAKHRYEISVNPSNGSFLAGDGHAPLIYAQDPRHDLPKDLENRIASVLVGCDQRLVHGWLAAAQGETQGQA